MDVTRDQRCQFATAVHVCLHSYNVVDATFAEQAFPCDPFANAGDVPVYVDMAGSTFNRNESS